MELFFTRKGCFRRRRMIIIAYILIATLFSFGWCSLFNEGMILERVGRWMDDHLKEWVRKPLYDCPKCNSFWVATAMYWFFWGDVWYIWLTIGGCAIGLAGIILSIQNHLEDIADGVH